MVCEVAVVRIPFQKALDEEQTQVDWLPTAQQMLPTAPLATDELEAVPEAV